MMWCARRGLPSPGVNRNDGRDLAGIADQNEATGDLTEQHEVCPCELPRLVDEQNVKLLDAIEHPPLRRGTDDNARIARKLLLARDDFVREFAMSWRSGRETNRIDLEILHQTPANVV